MSNSSHTDPVTARAPYPFGQAGSGSTGRKISFRQLHNRTGARVRHTVCADVDHLDAAIAAKEIPAEETVEETGANGVSIVPAVARHPDMRSAAVKREDLVK